MRTTLSLEDDVFATAKQLAAARGVGVGKVISDLVRKGLEHPHMPKRRSGMPRFDVPPGTKPITPGQVKELLEDEW